MDLSKIGKIIYTEEEIAREVKRLGMEISTDYKDKNPVLVSVLKGTLYFLADLTRHIDVDLNLDFMSIGVYATGGRTSGIVRITKDLDINITARNVLIIEDIINTGLTLSYLVQNMEVRKPESIKICTLLDSPSKRLVNLPIAYRGFQVPDTFLVGYGLDYNEDFRHLPYIAEYREQVNNKR